MAEEVFLKKKYLQDIADAIREKNGQDRTYMPYEFSSAIRDLASSQISDIEEYIRGGEIVASGYEGDCPWVLTSQGTLVIGDPEKTTYLSEEYLSNPWANYNAEIYNIIINGEVVVPANMTNMFSGMKELWLIFNIWNLNTSLVKDFKSWFEGCENINTIDLTSWDASNIRSANWMFKGCSSLVEVKLPQIFHETEMIGMFAYSGFIHFKFYGNKVLRSSNLTQMFYHCENLISVDLAGIDISKVQYMEEMFAYCPLLKEVNVEPIFAPNLISMKKMFFHCYSLEKNPEKLFWKVPSLKNVSYMFQYCISLKEFYFDMPVFSLEDISGMFSECYSLEKIDWTNWINFFYKGEERLHDTSPFHDCWGLKELITGSRTMLSTVGWQKAHYDAYVPKAIFTAYEGIKPELTDYEKVVDSSDDAGDVIGYRIKGTPGYELLNCAEAGLRIDWKVSYTTAVTREVFDFLTGGTKLKGMYTQMNSQFTPAVNLPYDDLLEDTLMSNFYDSIYKVMIEAGLSKEQADAIIKATRGYKAGYLIDASLALPYYMVDQYSGLRRYYLGLNQPCHYIREDTLIESTPYYQYPSMHNFLSPNFSKNFTDYVVKHIEWRTNVQIPFEKKLPAVTEPNSQRVRTSYSNALSWDYDWDSKTLIIATPEDRFYLPPDSAGMFSGMTYLEDFSFEKIDAKYCCCYAYMFNDCSRLTTITNFAMNPASDRIELIPFQNVCDETWLEDIANYNLVDRKTKDQYQYDYFYIVGLDTMFKGCSDLRSITFSEVDWSRLKTINRGLKTYDSTLRRMTQKHVPTIEEIVVDKEYEKTEGYEQLSTDGIWYRLPLGNVNEVILSKYDPNRESIIPNYNINVKGLIEGPGKYIRERAITDELWERSFGMSDNVFYSGLSLRHMIDDYLESIGMSSQDLKRIEFRTRIITPHGTQYKVRKQYKEYVDEYYEGPYLYYNSDRQGLIIQTRAENYIIKDNAEYTFYNMPNLHRIGNFNKIYWENITNISHLFDGCTSLYSIDLSNFQLDTLTDTSYMFNNCVLFEYVDLTNFDFSEVTDMSHMFNNCWSLKEIRFSENIDTSNVVDMSHLFCNCNKLGIIDFKDFDTNKVRDMSYMFYNCESLESANFSNFNTCEARNMSYMFTGCNSLKQADFSSLIFCRKKDYIFAGLSDEIYECLTTQFNSENIYFNNLFEGCTATHLDLSRFNWHMARDMQKMFKDCVNLETLNLGDVESPWVYSLKQMFYNCEALTAITFTRWRTKGVTDIEELFSGCKSLVDLDFAKMDFNGRLVKASMLFMNCESLPYLDMSNCYLYCNCDRAFYNCRSLIKINDLRGQFIPPVGCSYYWRKPQFSGRIFYNCESLKELDLSNFILKNVYNYSCMFYNCKSLKTLDLRNTTVFNGMNYTSMFENCEQLEYLTLPEKINLTLKRPYTDQYVQYRDTPARFTAMFKNCYSLVEIKNIKAISGWQARSYWAGDNPTHWYLSEMFYNCKSLLLLDIDKIISNANRTEIYSGNTTWYAVGYRMDMFIREMHSTFYNCESLQYLHMPSDREMFFESYNIDLHDLFNGCKSLTDFYCANLHFNHKGQGLQKEYNSQDESDKYKYNFANLFKDCQKLTNIDLSTWWFNTYHNIAQITGLPYSNTGNLALSNEDIGNMSSMFENCYELEKIIWPKGAKSTGAAPTYDLITWVFPFMYIKNADKMFKNCYKLIEIEQECYPEIIFNTVVSAYQMMMNCKSIETNIVLLCSNYLQDMREIFSGCESMTYLDFRKHRTLFNYTEKENGLYNCLAMQQMDIGQFYDTARNAEIEGYSIKHLSDASWSIDLNNQWIEDGDNAINGSQVYKSNSNYHITNGNAYCYLMIQGYSRFSIRVRSNGESNYDYLIVGKLDQMSGLSTSNCEYHTYQKPSTTYTTVVYEIYDDNPHTITLLYRKNGSVDSNEDRAFFYVSPTYLDYNIVWYPMQFPKDMYTGVQNMYTIWNENIPIKLETYYDFSLLPEKYDSRLVPGSEFTYTIKRMANGANVTDGNYEDTKIKHIVFENGIQKSGTAIGSQGSPVVANWDNNTGTITITFEVAAPIILNANSMNMFYKLKGLQSIEGLDILDTSEVLNANGMFREMGTSSLELDLRTWDMSNCTNMQFIFRGCTANLINITDWDITNLTDISNWDNDFTFFYDSTIGTLEAKNLDFSNITNLRAMLYRSTFTNINIANWNVSSITSFRAMFRLSTFTNGLDLSTWDVSSVQNMINTFADVHAPWILFDTWDTSSVTDMTYMFGECFLPEINISTWDVSHVTTMYQMFKNNKAQIITLNNFDISFCTNMSRFMYAASALSLNIESTWHFSPNCNIDSMFYSWSGAINSLENFNVSLLKSMENMFLNYQGIELIFTNWNTTSCTNMRHMFEGCSKLKTLKIQSFDTSKVQNFGQMFYNCSSLEIFETNSFKLKANGNNNYISGPRHPYGYLSSVDSMFMNIKIDLNIGHWDVSEQVNFAAMFANYKGTSIDLSDWNILYETNNISWLAMFTGSSTVKVINLSSFYTQKVKDIRAIFSNCAALERVIYRDNIFYFQNKTFDDNCFYGCYKLNLALDTWNIEGCKSISALFAYYRGTTIDLSSWITQGADITNVSSLFYDCVNLTSVNLSGMQDWHKITTFSHMFYNCKKLQYVDITYLDSTIVIDMSDMFALCENLLELDFSNFNTNKTTSLDSMFYNSYKIRRLDLTSFHTQNVTNFYEMFHNCQALEELLIPNFDTSKWSGENAKYMFCNCYALKELYLPDTFTMINNTSAERMFQWCKSLRSIRIPETFGGANLKRVDGMFEGCEVLEEIAFPDSFISQKCVNFEYMFQHCYALKKLTQHFNMTKAQSTTCMLQNCYALENLNTYQNDNGWLFSNVMCCQAMFNNCRSLKALDLHSVSFTRAGGASYYGDFGCYNGARSLSNLFGNCWALENLNANALFLNDCHATNISNMFINCRSLKTLDLQNFSFVELSSTGAQYLFAGCWVLESINLKYTKFVGLTSLEGWFQNCHSLNYIDWYLMTVTGTEQDMSPIQNMSRMFQGCWAITKIKFTEDDSERAENNSVIASEIDMTTWNVNKVTVTEQMFENCNNLITVDIAYSNFTRIQNSKEMFKNCISLKEVIFPENYNKNINQGTYVYYDSMFEGCSSLEAIEFPNLIVANDYTRLQMSNMFKDCISLRDVEFRRAKQLYAYNNAATDCLAGCSSLKNIYFSECEGWTGGNSLIRWICNGANKCGSFVTLTVEGTINNNFNEFIRGAVRIKYIHMKEWIEVKGEEIILHATNKPSSLNYAFAGTGIHNLKDILMDFSNVTNYTYCFDTCPYLTILDTSLWSMREQADCNFNYAFNEGKMTTIDASKLSIEKINSINYAFRYCSNLVSLIIPQFIGSYTDLCYGSSKITNITFLNYNDTEKIRTILRSSMSSSSIAILLDNFNGTKLSLNDCQRVKSFNIINSDTSIITNLNSCFYNTKLSSFDFDLLNVSNVTNMAHMFNNCTNLSSIHVGKINTPLLTTVYRMFYNCNSLTSLDFSEWTCSAVQDFREIFEYCSNLNTLDISGWDFNSITNSDSMFYGNNNLKTIYARGAFKDFKSNTQTYLGSYGITSIYVPLSLIDKYKKAYQWKNVANAIKDGSDKELVGLQIESSIEKFNSYEFDTYYHTAQLAPIYIDPDNNIDVDPIYRGVTWTVEQGDVTVDENGLVTFISGQEGENVIIRGTCIYNNEITATINIKIIYFEKFFNINLYNGEWIDSGILAENKYPIYQSNAHIGKPGTKDRCEISLVGYTDFTIKYRSNGESNCDYLWIGLDKNPDSLSDNNYTIITRSSPSTTYKSYTFTNLGRNSHTISIVYKKDGSVNRGEDRGFFYIPIQNL